MEKEEVQAENLRAENAFRKWGRWCFSSASFSTFDDKSQFEQKWLMCFHFVLVECKLFATIGSHVKEVMFSGLWLSVIAHNTAFNNLQLPSNCSTIKNYTKGSKTLKTKANSSCWAVCTLCPTNLSCLQLSAVLETRWTGLTKQEPTNGCIQTHRIMWLLTTLQSSGFTVYMHLWYPVIKYHIAMNKPVGRLSLISLIS